MNKEKSWIENKLKLRKRLDKTLEKVRIEVDIWRCYEEVLQKLQDEYYEGIGVVFKREDNEAVISATNLWSMIQSCVNIISGEINSDKYSIAVYNLLSRDLDLYESFKNKDVTKNEN